MKKILSMLLMSFAVFSTSSTAFADVPKSTYISETWHEVMADLNYENNGGTYVEGDVMHIIPINVTAVKEIVEDAKIRTRATSNPKIVIDPVGKYSMQELIDASNKVFDNRKELEIFSTSVRGKENSITVGAETEWTDEKKQAVIDVAGIERDHIIFEVLPAEMEMGPEIIKKDAN